MNHKLSSILFYLFLFSTIPIVSADITINNSQAYFYFNNVTVNFSTVQTFNNITILSDQIDINNTRLQLIPNSPINVTINNYNTITNNYNITFNGTDPAVYFAQLVSSPGKYRFPGIDIITVGGVIYATVNANGANTYVWFLVPNTQNTVLCFQSQSTIVTYSNITIPLFGLALVIFAFAVVLSQLHGARNGGTSNPKLIVSSIIVGIVGFGMILIGNYLIYAILGATGC